MVGNTDTGHTGKEQNGIQPSDILAQFNHYIFFSAGSILHPHKFGVDCNHISLPPTIEYPPAIYSTLAVSQSSSSCVNVSHGWYEAQTFKFNRCKCCISSKSSLIIFLCFTIKTVKNGNLAKKIYLYILGSVGTITTPFVTC